MDPTPRVLITGASSGVGVAAAEQFALAGYDVALLARSVEGLEKAADLVRDAGQQALVVPADVEDQDRLEEVVGEVEAAFGGLDVLVLNAALTIYGPFRDVEAEDFDRVIRVSFLGAVNVTRLFLPLLERSEGTIVSVSSLNARVPLPGWSSYAASKHALRGFLNTLSVELQAQGSGVKVSQLLPGPINTPVWEQTASAVGHLPRRPPDGYPPEQVAEAVVKLARKPKAEVLFGAEAIAVDSLWSASRTAGDLMLSMVYHWFQSGRRPAQSDLDALREAVGRGVTHDGMLQRPSLSSAARGLGSLTGSALRAPAFVKSLIK